MTRSRWMDLYLKVNVVASSYPPKSDGRSIWVDIEFACLALARAGDRY